MYLTEKTTVKETRFTWYNLSHKYVTKLICCRSAPHHRSNSLPRDGSHTRTISFAYFSVRHSLSTKTPLFFELQGWKSCPSVALPRPRRKIKRHEHKRSHGDDTASNANMTLGKPVDGCALDFSRGQVQMATHYMRSVHCLTLIFFAHTFGRSKCL
jgi:hypothetical protein